MSAVDIQISSELLAFLKTPEFLYEQVPDYDGTKIGIPISLSTIRDNDFVPDGGTVSVFNHCLTFCKAVFGQSFDQSHEAWNNFGYASYEGDNLKVFSRPIIVNHDDQLCLLMGSQSKEEGKQYVTVPLVLNDKSQLTLKGSAIERLLLSSVDIPKAGSNERVKLPIAVFRASGQVYSISVRTPKDTDYFEVSEAWTSGDLARLEGLIGSLYGGSANLSNMFAPLFVSKRFPKNGIVIKVISGKRSTVNVNREGSTSKFEKVVYTIDPTDLPMLPVKAYVGGEDSVISITDVTQISCYSSHDAAIPVIQQGKEPSPSEPWYLHIQGASNNPNQVPKHQIYTGFVPPRIKTLIQAQQGFSAIAGNDDDNYDNNPL